MPPKSTKVTKDTKVTKTQEVASKPIVATKSLEDLLTEWTDVVKNITLLKEQIGPLETKRDNITSQMLNLMDKTSDKVDTSSIIETAPIPIEHLVPPPETVVKGKGKTKATTEVVDKPEPKQPAARKAPVKKGSKAVESESEPVVPPTKTTKGKKTEPEVTKTVAKDKKPVSKGKAKLEEDSETEVPVKKECVSSSDTDIESLSSCSSESEESAGEED